MIKIEVGNNAGVIWQLLNERGALTIREIGEYTNCKDSSIFLALGWLLRENKIYSSLKKNELIVELNRQFPEWFY